MKSYTELPPTLVECLTNRAIESSVLNATQLPDADKTATRMPAITPDAMKKYQEEDKVISRLIHYRKLKRRPNFTERAVEDKATLLLLKQWDRSTFRRCSVSKDQGLQRHNAVPAVVTRISERQRLEKSP